MGRRTRLLSAGKLAEELLDVQRRGGAAVVVVPVHVQHLLPGDGEQAAQQALLHAGAQDHSVPLLGECRAPVLHCSWVVQYLWDGRRTGVRGRLRKTDASPPSCAKAGGALASAHDQHLFSGLSLRAARQVKAQGTRRRRASQLGETLHVFSAPSRATRRRLAHAAAAAAAAATAPGPRPRLEAGHMPKEVATIRNDRARQPFVTTCCLATLASSAHGHPCLSRAGCAGPSLWRGGDG